MKEKAANCDCGLGTGKTTVPMDDNPLTILPNFSKLVCEISTEITVSQTKKEIS